nr:hypothetical protein Iba_chr04eCG1950 [Ipomoea batatas]
MREQAVNTYTMVVLETVSTSFESTNSEHKLQRNTDRIYEVDGMISTALVPYIRLIATDEVTCADLMIRGCLAPGQPRSNSMFYALIKEYDPSILLRFCSSENTNPNPEISTLYLPETSRNPVDTLLTRAYFIVGASHERKFVPITPEKP